MEVVRGRMSQKFVWNHCVVFVDDVSFLIHRLSYVI
ncbi:unnamed protein product [Brassica rapa]|uniref:Uncharacterized protein n=1 Tax=Brassica campestris TaxID=3711 RepID=A0A8D9GLE2_BRACM|nr:unnamed protein product [Brassica rapa]CAG7883234.1 unnamed protein product [Brassica rapa]